MRTCAWVVAFVAAAAHLGAQAPDGPIEWPYVGGRQAHTKHSPAAQITRDNVDQLEIAWQWEPNELPLPELGARPGSFQATPIMIDNVLYLSTMYSRVVALDAETGAELWAFDPMAYEREPQHGYRHRGIAYWRDGDDFRILLNSRDRLYAIDAATGRAVTSFGEGGSVSLIDGLGRPVSPAEFDQTSPPVVFEDLVVVGNRTPDQVQHKFDAPGSVQAFDVRTGARRWVFFTIPQSNDEFGADTWENESWRYHRPRECLGADVARRGTRPAVRADQHAQRRLLGRAPAGREPVRRIARLSGRPDRRAAVALPGGAPRRVGLRLHFGAEPGHDQRGRAHDRCRGGGVETGLHVRVRPGDGRAGVAH